MSKQHNTQDEDLIAEVALPVPLRKVFDYKTPPALAASIVVGVRVQVPFGRRRLVGLVTRIKTTADVSAGKLKTIIECIDDEPVFPPALLELLQWAAEYYQHPLGEVLKTALPGAYTPCISDTSPCYSLASTVSSAEVDDRLARAPRQQQVIEIIRASGESVSSEHLEALGEGWRRALNELVKKRLVKVQRKAALWQDTSNIKTGALPELTAEQDQVIRQVTARLNEFIVSLLMGVTGSGKTEVYLHLARTVLDQGRQVLVLVPEIALTPQLVARFEQRLGLRVAVLHSALGEKDRRMAWQAAGDGRARVVLGTRSAVFTAMANPGLIILDEEHDASYKQQEGFRYHARDVAIMRARKENIPVLLGSATPSLESLANVKRGRYRMFELKRRIGEAVLPVIHLLSMDQLPARQGLSVTLVNAIGKNLADGRQSLVFINRRGFAPVLMCKACGEAQSCRDCNARLTWHQDNTLRCHHCGSRQPDSGQCPHCNSGELVKLGLGTQRVEQVLGEVFPKARIARLDRDAVHKKDELEAVLNSVITRQVDILVGTQMLSKGHDFPAVTLVAVVNADQGLFGTDFHSTEAMIQQLIQVSGRAGRAEDKGRVLIQTQFPDHPLYLQVSQHDYMGFAKAELQLRQRAGFPPFHHLALLRVSALDEAAPMRFLNWARALAQPMLSGFPAVVLMEPVISPMARRKGRHHAQMLISSTSRGARQAFLAGWIDVFESHKRTRVVRWSIDVDPVDLY